MRRGAVTETGVIASIRLANAGTAPVTTATTVATVRATSTKTGIAMRFVAVTTRAIGMVDAPTDSMTVETTAGCPVGGPSAGSRSQY